MTPRRRARRASAADAELCDRELPDDDATIIRQTAGPPTAIEYPNDITPDALSIVADFANSKSDGELSAAFGSIGVIVRPVNERRDRIGNRPERHQSTFYGCKFGSDVARSQIIAVDGVRLVTRSRQPVPIVV